MQVVILVQFHNKLIKQVSNLKHPFFFFNIPFEIET
jgi:hypothetical protein